jgi:outer membrane autotransporter protein
MAEFRIGLQGHVTENLNLWAKLSLHKGANSYEDKAAILGLRYKF